MGIYIPNIEKPKSCLECWSSGLSGVINCEAGTGFHNPDGDLIPSDCPLIEIVTCGECKKVDTKKCPMYSAGWGYTDDDWCSEGERRADDVRHNEQQDF